GPSGAWRSPSGTARSPESLAMPTSARRSPRPAWMNPMKWTRKRMSPGAMRHPELGEDPRVQRSQSTWIRHEAVPLIAAQHHAAVLRHHHGPFELRDPAAVDRPGFPLVRHVVMMIALDHDRLDGEDHPFLQPRPRSGPPGERHVRLFPHPCPEAVATEP